MKREYKIVTIAATAHFLCHMYILIFPALAIPLSREFGEPLSVIFPLAFPMYFLYGASAIPAGYIADRWTKIGVLRFAMLGMGFSAIAAGFSSGVTELTMSLAALGFFCGLYHPAGMALIAHEIPKQGIAHGINGIFGNLGIAAAPLIAGGALIVADWRWAFIATGGLGVIGVVISYVMAVEETTNHEMAKSRGDDPHRSDYWLYFGILCLAMTTAGLTYRASMTTLPAYFERYAENLLNGLASAMPSIANGDALSGAAGLLAGTVFFFSMVGQYVGGKTADRHDLRYAYLFFQSMAFPFALGMWYFADLPLYLAAGGYAFFTLGMQPIENSLVSKFLPRKWLSTGYGIKFTLVFGVGSLAVYQVAFIESGWGLSALYPVLAAQTVLIATLAAILIVASRKKVPKVVNG